MASNEVKIKVIIDGHTHSLNAARKDVNELGKSLANTDTVANALKGTFGKIALSLGGVTALGVAVKNVATSGIEASRSFENLKIQLTGLISANSSNVSLLGKTLDAHSKWNLGMAESEKILKKLNETNAKTKFTLEEIAGAFNMFYATSAGQGSRDKAVQAMDSIALAAQAVGKNIRDLTPMMDSLATGTVIAASEMGSFMKIVGLSNEELKKANENGKVYDYLIEKLAKFKELSGEAANGYEVALGSLKNELTELNKELSKPIFGALTTGMVTFSNLLRENKDDLVKYGGYAIETMKHLGLLAGSFIAAKGAVIALSGAFSMIKGAIAAAAAMMPAFTSSLTLSITTGVVLEKGLATLNRAFATLLPAATIYLLYESIDAIKVLNGNLEDGAKNLNSVQKWIYRFLDSFTTQLQIGHIKIYQFINDLKIMALKAKEFFDSINPFSRGEGAKDAQKDIALLEKYNQAYDELIEKYKQGAVAKELNLQGFKLDENGNILTDAKQKVDKLKDSIDKLGGSAGNAGKKDLNAMKAALKDIAEVNFSDMELKTQRVIDRYNEMLSLGIDKGKAKHFLDSKLEAITNENIKAVEKSEAEAIAKQLDLRAQYYKTIGEYENAWQIEKQKIIEKYEKLTFANGEKLTKEQLDKLLKMEKTAFLQGAKIAKNS
uniref:hypothetical protein n=1 Tax=Campylobacter sp. RM16191 TaxID=1705728 RepID=UPI001475DEBF